MILRLAGALVLAFALQGCFTIATILMLSVEHTHVALSVDRAWLTPDDVIELDIDVYSGNGEERTLRASIAPTLSEAAFAAGDSSKPQRLPAHAVHLGPKAPPPAGETVSAAVPIVRLAEGATPISDLRTLPFPEGADLAIFELTREVEGPKGAPIDFGIAVVRRSPGSGLPQAARFEITLEDPAGKNNQSELVRLLMAIGADLLVVAIVSSMSFMIMAGG